MEPKFEEVTKVWPELVGTSYVWISIRRTMGKKIFYKEPVYGVLRVTETREGFRAVHSAMKEALTVSALAIDLTPWYTHGVKILKIKNPLGKNEAEDLLINVLMSIQEKFGLGEIKLRYMGFTEQTSIFPHHNFEVCFGNKPGEDCSKNYWGVCTIRVDGKIRIVSNKDNKLHSVLRKFFRLRRFMTWKYFN
jgi:hypothetical protein